MASNVCREFVDKILGILEGDDSIYPSGNYKVNGDHIQDLSVSPNLSSCHSSYGRPDLLVHCCPPESEGEEAIIDFQFPDPLTPLRV
ncbi:unnamed protein product [Prunus armeniaca]|uniref:Uncharacterized protein n=1 Tax=Prunus armeniaca TaxID=36596 RepID=A0A6J5VQQ7_PRUAR|nr:unnamed protein product [Prunus armeniaca]